MQRPTSEGTCPSGTPVCGDDVIQTPFEVCDGANDAACPGRCGANGLACLCPRCGDGVIDPGEACDGFGALGTCTEGCSHACACTTCGNGVVEAPAEDCEADADCGDGTCGAVGGADQCLCRRCGDGIVNQANEQCDGADDAACPGACQADCTCP